MVEMVKDAIVSLVAEYGQSIAIAIGAIIVLFMLIGSAKQMLGKLARASFSAGEAGANRLMKDPKSAALGLAVVAVVAAWVSHAMQASPAEKAMIERLQSQLEACGEARLHAELKAEAGQQKQAKAVIDGMGEQMERYMVSAFGEPKTTAEWAKDDRCGQGVTAATIYMRVVSGWATRRAVSIPANCQEEMTEERNIRLQNEAEIKAEDARRAARTEQAAMRE